MHTLMDSSDRAEEIMTCESKYLGVFAITLLLHCIQYGFIQFQVSVYALDLLAGDV